jgi:hypothetical protein
MSVSEVCDCAKIQSALHNAAVVLGDGVWESIEMQLQAVYRLRLEPPCSTVEEMENALIDLLGTSADLMLAGMRSFMR